MAAPWRPGPPPVKPAREEQAVAGVFSNHGLPPAVAGALSALFQLLPFPARPRVRPMGAPVIGITADFESQGAYSKFPWYALR